MGFLDGTAEQTSWCAKDSQKGKGRAMMNQMTVREWQKAFAAGEFDGADVSTQCKAGWFDWFCKGTSLVRRTQRMGKIVAKVKDGGKVDLDGMYVWFKNNCPLCGPLYDDFRFADIETGDVHMTICIDDVREEFKYSVWGRANGFDGPIIGFSNSRELVKWLNTAE